jgi:hypothetical protein
MYRLLRRSAWDGLRRDETSYACSTNAPLFSVGVADGATLNDRSELGAFLHDDVLRQYAVEVFIDPQVDASSRERILARANEVFRSGIDPEVEAA